MTNVLERIYAQRRADVADLQTHADLQTIRARAADTRPTRSFAEALARVDRIAIIAEIKFRSPSQGLIRSKSDVEDIAWDYAANGADALSVLTEPHEFGGDVSFILRAKASCPLPVLRKDFIFDPYQIYESRAAGADAVLLIAAMLERSQLIDLSGLAREQQMAVLLEIHDASELATCRGIGDVIWGVNHRNLATLDIDLSLSETLFPLLPPGSQRVAESGIETAASLKAMHERGANAALIGTSLMKAVSPGAALAKLLSHVA